MTKPAIFTLLILLTLSCRSHSKLNESPGHANPQKMGIDEVVTYEDIASKRSADLGFEKPWASDYWAKANRSMAMRWRTQDRSKIVYLKLSDFLMQAIEIIYNANDAKAQVRSFNSEHSEQSSPIQGEQPDSVASNNNIARVDGEIQAFTPPNPAPKDTYLGYDLLSPGEKYDLLLNQINPKAISLKPPFTAKAIKNLDDVLSRVNLPQGLRDDIQLIKSIEEEKDGDDERSIHKRLLSAIRSGSQLTYLKNQFPLVVDGFYAYAARAASKRHTVDGNKDENNKDLLSWSWEGICHGWSAAAISQKEPKQAVLARKNGKDVLFLEHDIRGLLSKAWANQGATQREAEKFFLGGRCRLPVDKIMRDKRSARVLDGIFCENGNLDSCRLAKEQTWMGRIESFSAPASIKGTQTPVLAIRYNVFSPSAQLQETENATATPSELEPREADGQFSYGLPLYFSNSDAEPVLASFSDKDTVKKALGRFVQSAVSNRVMTIIPFEDLEDLQTFLKIPRIKDQKLVDILQSDCRPLNPATIHMALTHFIHDRNQSLVMDVTASQEVWNQPISSFEIGEFHLEDYSLLKEKDQLKDHRAPGTKYLAEVTTDIFYQAEPHLFHVVTKDQENGFKKSGGEGELVVDFDDIKESKKVSLNYILEFDFKRRLIGGEWGKISQNDSGRHPDKAPDFIWGFKNHDVEHQDIGYLNFSGKNKKNQQKFDASYLKKIYECSLNATLEKKTVVLHDHHLDRDYEVGFVECDLD